MNKKLFFSLFAATGMLFATSCSNDELESAQSGNEAQVTFSLGLEGGIATRTISDGTGAKKLVCAIYDANDNVLNQVVINDIKVNETTGQYVKDNAFQGGLTDNVKITLAKGQTYTMVFWAQNGACDAYDTNDLTAVKVDYTDGAETDAKGDINNDETRDAFYAAETFKVEGDKKINVTLKRPFAQINVGVYQEDWDAAVASGIEIEKSSVVIKNVADQINLLTGAVEASEAMGNGITYTLGDIPDETLYVETDATKDGKEAYVWLSMSYILVNDGSESTASVDGAQKSTLNGLQYTFAPEENKGQPIAFAEGLAGAPVQRNWRTNILGKILTGHIQFNITIDPAYDGDYIYPDGTAEQELKLAATFGGTYTLTEDQTLPYLNVNADFIFNIENGKTLTSGSATDYGIIVRNGTTSINGNGNIASKGGGIGIVNGANVIFNGGNLDINTTSTSGRYLFYLEGAGSTATINGGNFDFNRTQNQKRAYIYASEGTTVYVNGGTFGKASTRDEYTAGILGTGTVIIKGGTFGFDPTTWVADGYKVETIDDKYVVFANTSTSVTSTDDLSNLNGTVNVSESIDYSNKQISIENNLIFNMSNNEVKAGSASDYGLVVNGVYTQFDNANINSLGGGIGAVDGANVVFNSGNLAVNTTSTAGRYNFYAVGNGTTVTINSGNFSFSSTLNQKRAYIYAGSGATVYVKGGTFGKASTRNGYTAGILGDGNIVITGGTFGFNPTQWVESGYKATESNGTWTVTAE